MSLTQQRNVPAWPLAKIAPPRPRALVSRPRLLGPLNEAARDGRVALVVAPGGSGKTSLLADWARQPPVPIAWYAIDAADRDMQRLTSGLCAAVDRAIPGAATAARAALDSEAQEAAVVGLLLGAIEQHALALILDDFHHLDGLPEAMALWDHLLRFRPPSLSLIILSRSVPLLGFAALAALDELTGLGRDDLRFDRDETAELLAAHSLDTGAAAPLCTRSGGWATGVLLLARTASNGLHFLRARSEALMDHLGTEMLASLGEELRDFLLETAALGPATAEEADAILDRSNSALLYAEVAAHGLFLEQDSDSGLYRYQDLFSEYLVGVLKREDPARLRTTRRAAARWWLRREDFPRALELLAAGEDWAELAATLDRERLALWTRGLWGTALAYAERLPPDYRTPRLLTLCGHGRLQRGEHAEALTLADASMAASVNEEDWLGAAALRAHALQLGDRNEEAIRSADAALVVARRLAIPAAETRLLETRGAARLRLGQLEEGQADLLAAVKAYHKGQDRFAEARSLLNLAILLIETGYARAAHTQLTRSSVLWRQISNQAVIGKVYNTRALLRVLTGDPSAARPDAERALHAAREFRDPELECDAMTTLAEICIHSGHAPEAERYAAAAVEMSARLDLSHSLNDALRAHIAAVLLRRERGAARRLIDEARALTVTPVDNALLDLLEGMLALRSRAHIRAAEVLDTAAKTLERLSRPHSAARAHLLRAEALLASGTVRRAEDALNRMAELVLPLGCEGYLQPTARLARQVLAQRHLLRRLRRDARQLLDQLATSAAPTLSVLPAATAGEPETLQLRISPFGQGSIMVAGQPLDLAALPPKARELLFYAVHARRPLRRDEMLETVWGGDVNAAQALWDAGRHLRRVLGDQSWKPRGGAYTLQMPFEDDGRCFDDAAAAALREGLLLERLGAAEQALEVYGAGGYLEWCDSLWAEEERARLAAQATRVALALAGIYSELNRHDDAIETCRRAAALDPFDEAPRLALLRALADAQRIPAALREYHDYQRLLHDELAAEPSDELRALATELSRR